MGKKSTKLQEEDFYVENGLYVLTEAFHRKRGYCCGNGCRHCPYDYEHVEELRRAELLKLRQEKNKDNE